MGVDRRRPHVVLALFPPDVQAAFRIADVEHIALTMIFSSAQAIDVTKILPSGAFSQMSLGLVRAGPPLENFR